MLKTTQEQPRRIEGWDRTDKASSPIWYGDEPPPPPCKLNCLWFDYLTKTLRGLVKHESGNYAWFACGYCMDGSQKRCDQHGKLL